MKGMEAIPTHSGHQMMHSGDEHHQMMIADFRNRFYVVLILTIPIMLLSGMIQQWLHFKINFTGSSYVLFSFSSAVFFYGGWPFLAGWLRELKAKTPGMMALIGFAITISYIYSSAVVFGLKGMDFFWELSTLILVMLVGHWIEMTSVAGASRGLELLVKLIPDVAHLVSEKGIVDVETNSLKPNDNILIKPGEKIPADGEVYDSESYVNESMLTGESIPVKKNAGLKVFAGSINGNGSLRIKVSHGSKDNYLSKVITLVKAAQDAKSSTQLLADKAAKWLTLIALSAGALTCVYWLADGKDLAFAIERMVTVMVICCPHALGLAIPLVVAKSTSLSASHGILIKNRTAFENSRKITTVVFDKTGTLTTGNFEVGRVVSTAHDGINNKQFEIELIRNAAAVEQNSEHPIATGIMRELKKRSLDLPEAKNFKALPGQGAEALVEGKQIKIVGPGYLQKNNIPLPDAYQAKGDETIIFVIVDDVLLAYIALSDTLRPEAAAAIQTLHHQGIKALLLTGDNEQVAQQVSQKLKMDGYFAGVLPEQKLKKIKELQQKGGFVAMTGDGVNDAPALAQADIGIAIGSGSDIAAETAGIILVNSNPGDVVSLILFGKATYRKMIQNLIWATGYNVVAIPLAAGVLYHQDILLTPAVGAALMSISTIVVAINASFLKIKEESPIIKATNTQIR